MKKFIWTRDFERKIHHALSDKSRRLASKSDAILKEFGRLVDLSEHYYSYSTEMYKYSRTWKNINKSSVFRTLERNERLFEGVGLIFTAIELHKAMTAPPGSIIIATMDIGGPGFEVIKPNDPEYKDALSLLPGAC